MKLFLTSLLLFSPFTIFAKNESAARIGSKIFTEGYLLSEILAVQLEKNGFEVKRLGGLGATGVTESAMKNNEIDLIVDYSGSVSKAFLNEPRSISIEEMNHRLLPLGFEVSNPLGFNNTYALAVSKAWANKNKISKISEFKKLKSVTAAFTPEFANRTENWIDLNKTYHLDNFKIIEMDHQLAYESLKNEKVDVVEAYSTDAKLKQYDLMALEDDLGFFTKYDAIIMTNMEWRNKNQDQWAILKQLEGTISESLMIDLNSKIDLEKKSFNEVASQFLNVKAQSNSKAIVSEIVQATGEHLALVVFPVFLALIIGLPLAYLSYRVQNLQPLFGSVASVFQTVPSLAFLTLLIPFFGIGTTPAIIVLSLYALLPIFISSLYGFKSIPENIHLTTFTLKLSPIFKFYKIELPIALPGVLAGLQTAVVTTVATATLAALIGSGGYGKKIIAGLAVNDMSVMLSGAIPSAGMALVFQVLFHYLNKLSSNNR